MRIISGQFSRRILKTPRGNATRPTSDRVREAIFNLVVNRIDLEGVDALDLFAGTGSLGLESLSRGTDSAVFVESDPAVLRLCRENSISLGVQDRCRFHQSDSYRFLKSGSSGLFGVIFADPPYGDPGISELPGLALPRLVRDGLFVLEHDNRTDFPSEYCVVTKRSYGRTTVSVFTRTDSEIHDDEQF
jgi:16S rRNA (guanine966-N2)-methyltransferase